MGAVEIRTKEGNDLWKTMAEHTRVTKQVRSSWLYAYASGIWESKMYERINYDKWRRKYGLRRHCLSIEIRYNIYRLRIKESVVGVLFVWGEMSGFFYYLFFTTKLC